MQKHSQETPFTMAEKSAPMRTDHHGSQDHEVAAEKVISNQKFEIPPVTSIPSSLSEELGQLFTKGNTPVIVSGNTNKLSADEDVEDEIPVENEREMLEEKTKKG